MTAGASPHSPSASPAAGPDSPGSDSPSSDSPRSDSPGLAFPSSDFPSSEEIAAQEDELQFDTFGSDDAYRLGLALVEEARRRGAAVAIDIRRGEQQLFHAALPGTAADNDSWLIRKGRVVTRFGQSSLRVGQRCREAGESLQQRFALPEAEYAAHGGAFPVAVRGVGVVGYVAVSGLPQLEDHALVVTVLRVFLGPSPVASSGEDVDRTVT